MDTNKTPTIYNLLAQSVEQEIKEYYGQDTITPKAFKNFCELKNVEQLMTYKSFSRLLKGHVSTPDDESIRTYLQLIGMESIQEFKELHSTPKEENRAAKTEVISTRPNYYLPKPKSKKKKYIIVALILFALVVSSLWFFILYDASRTSQESIKVDAESDTIEASEDDSIPDVLNNSEGGDIFYNNKGTINIEENHIENQTNHYGEE